MADEYEFLNVIFEAEEGVRYVLSQFVQMLDTYPVIYVAYLYNVTNHATKPDDYKYGWDDLRGAKVVRIKENQYQIDFPIPKRFKD